MTQETFRKMASIQKVEEIKSIPEADRICAYRIQGWWIVDQVGKYCVGDFIIYCETDSWIPTKVAPFLTKSGQFPKEYMGVEGERLKTVRLRRQLSQGLILPLSVLEFDYDVVPGEICVTSEFIPDSSSGICIVDQKDGLLGLDVSGVLGILKWEPPPEFTAANARGSFPSWGRKTDQERCFEDKTSVLTEDGSKSIKEICETKYTGKVLSFDGISNVFMKIIDHSIMPRKKGWVRITTKSGKILTVTKNHLIYLPKLCCYREAQELELGDILKIF